MGMGLTTPAGRVKKLVGGNWKVSDSEGKAGAEAGAWGDNPGVDTSILESGLCRANVGLIGEER